MKIETPLLRWHQEMNPSRKQDENANGPIRSCSLLTLNDNVGILATAGNAEVNLWRVGFTADETRLSSSANTTASKQQGAQDGASTKNKDGAREPTSHILVQPVKNKDEEPANKAEHTQIKHIVTLSRGTSERAINAVKFSPSGQYLVAVGDAGTIVVWTIPQQTTSKANHSFWSNLEEEKDLPMKILFNHTDDVMDVAWSADSKRFTVCSLDHTMNVWEMKDDWKKVINKDKEHTHYIQGVAYDPKGVYLASMGSDRMVKVYTRKSVSKNVIKGELEKYVTADKPTTTTAEGGGEEEKKNSDGEKQQQQKVKETPEEKEKKHAIVQNQILPEVFANNKFELQKGGTKTIKFFSTTSPSTKANAAAVAPSSNAAEGEEVNKESTPTKTNNTGNTKRHHMFADELTLGSFFRRLSFTTDGAFLVVPAALWHGRDNSSEGKQASPTSVGAVNKLDESSFATYLFARHHFDQPYKVLAGLEKPSVAIRPNPVLYQLPPNSTASALPYRSIFAVLTSDTVLIYDTHHNQPLAMANGLHFATLTDATWSNDGNTLFVTSSDGYISILNFGKGELGEVYEAPAVNVAEKVDKKVTNESKAIPSNKEEPKSNAAVVNTLVPKKKEKKSTEEALDTVEADTAASSEEASGEKKSVSFDEPLDDRSNQPVVQPVINTLIPKKKKKKIAPTAVQPESTQSTTVSGGEKRSIEEVSATVEPVVNILVAKKKQKVAESSIPAPTM